MDDKSRFRVRITEVHDKKKEPESDQGDTMLVFFICLIFGGLFAMGIWGASLR